MFMDRGAGARVFERAASGFGMRFLRAVLILLAISSSGISAAADDACVAAKASLGKAICDIAIVQKTYGEIRAAYEAALTRLSPEGQSFLKQDQEAWETRTKAACVDHPKIAQSHAGDFIDMSVIPEEVARDGALGGATPTNFCLFEAYRDRKSYLSFQPAQQGAFIFQTVDLRRDAYCDSDPAAADNRLSFERSIWRIDAPINEAARHWNARHANLPAEEQHDACAHDGRVVREAYVTFAQGDFVALLSRELVLYYDKSHDYIWGQPTYGKQVVHMAFEQVSTGRRLGAADFFVPESGWESFVGKRAYAEYLAALKDGGATARRSEADYIAQAGDVDHWSIDAKTFACEFPPTDADDFGSATTFTWSELRPYLRDDLPFQPDFN